MCVVVCVSKCPIHILAYGCLNDCEADGPFKLLIHNPIKQHWGNSVTFGCRSLQYLSFCKMDEGVSPPCVCGCECFVCVYVCVFHEGTYKLCLWACVSSSLRTCPLWIKEECQCCSIITLAQCTHINRSPSSAVLAVISTGIKCLPLLGTLMCSLHNVFE